MTKKFVYWAQALDNISPDHIEFLGEELTSDDTIRRQEAASLVSKVVKSGTRIFSNAGVHLTEDGRHFVVEVPSEQHDEVGRNAPIVCCGEYKGQAVDEAFGQFVTEGIGEFGQRIGRTIRLEHLELARGAFAILEDRISKRRIVRVVGIGALTLALLALLFLCSRGR